MPCRQRPLEQYSHISSTRSYSPPPHRPTVLPGVHGICLTVSPSHRAAVSDSQLLTYPPNRERSDLQLGSAITPPSISPTPVAPQTSSSSSSSSMSCLAVLGRPGSGDLVRRLAFLRQAPLSRDAASGTVPCARLGGLLFGMGRGGYKRIYLVWWAGGKGVADVKACER